MEVSVNSDGDTFTCTGDAWSANGFTGTSGETSDLWLILGEYDLSSTTAFDLIFDATENFDGSGVEVFYSTSYSGCPSDAANAWVSAGLVETSTTAASFDLSAAAGASAVYIGIQYLSGSGGGEVSGWTVSNLGLTADACPAVNAALASNCGGAVEDCPGLGNIGDACDDMDANTENDVLQADCSCAGTPIQTGTCGTELYIAGAMDATLTGGLPKAIQICATAAIADLSAYGIESVSNGGGSASAAEFNFPADALAAGDCIWVTNDLIAFNTFMGIDACYETNDINSNGDDAYILYCSTGVMDVLGDPDNDGTGTLWEYTDGWATSNDMLPNPVFDETEWTYSGVDGLDSTGDSNATAASPYPNTDVACPGGATEDCPGLGNIGDSCDDNDANTENDVLQADCSCAGTPIQINCDPEPGTFPWNGN